jgi:hypothetical protein
VTDCRPHTFEECRSDAKMRLSIGLGRPAELIADPEQARAGAGG